MPGRGDSANVATYLLHGKDAGSVALRTIDRTVPYGELDQDANRAATLLNELGARKGDRVALVAENSPFWIAAYLGILRAGLVAVPLPPSISPDDWRFARTFTDARILMAERSWALRFDKDLGDVRLITDTGTRQPAGRVAAHVLDEAEPSDVEEPAVGPDDLAALMFTSGSTARPRAVMISHGNIRANTDSIVEYLELRSDDRMMTVLPFYYCYGTSLVHTHLAVGAQLVIDHRFMYPEMILDRMAETACTGFAGIPSHFRILLAKSTLAKRDFPSLRHIQQAGGHMAAEEIRRLQSVLPRTRIFVMYGQTEATARLSYLPPELVETKAGSVGKGIPGVELRVVDESGNEVRPGEVGEILARGPNIARGYWNEPADEVFPNGDLRTGDMATVDDDGFITIVDRKQDFLKCRGERVSTRRLEAVFSECPGVLEIAIVGVEDEILGEAVRAVVVPESRVEGIEDHVRRFAKTRMPAHLVPKDIVVVDSLPRNATGKVLKSRLAGRSALQIEGGEGETRVFS